MRLISWNVNGYRAVDKRGQIDLLLETYNPDILFLQEIKCDSDKLPIISDDYYFYINSGTVKGRHGTLSLIKNELECDALDIDNNVEGIDEGRFQMLVMGDICFMNTYTVNSRENLTRLPLRKIYDDTFYGYMQQALQKKKLIVCGDFNVVHNAIDIHTGYIDNTIMGMSDVEREGFNRFLSLGLIDVFRNKYVDARKYTYWSNFGRARIKNLGWRLDYFLVDKSIIQNVKEIGILDFNGSDHAPIMLDINL